MLCASAASLMISRSFPAVLVVAACFVASSFLSLHLSLSRSLTLSLSLSFLWRAFGLYYGLLCLCVSVLTGVCTMLAVYGGLLHLHVCAAYTSLFVRACACACACVCVCCGLALFVCSRTCSTLPSWRPPRGVCGGDAANALASSHRSTSPRGAGRSTQWSAWTARRCALGVGCDCCAAVSATQTRTCATDAWRSSRWQRIMSTFATRYSTTAPVHSAWMRRVTSFAKSSSSSSRIGCTCLDKMRRLFSCGRRNCDHCYACACVLDRQREYRRLLSRRFGARAHR